MTKKIKINIPGFGERYCSDNVEYKIISNEFLYCFYKKGTNVYHNEYGPAIEYKDKSYSYYINDKYHRLGDYSFYNFENKHKSYDVIGKYIGDTKEEFIKKLANVLIPNDEFWL